MRISLAKRGRLFVSSCAIAVLSIVPSEGIYAEEYSEAQLRLMLRLATVKVRVTKDHATQSASGTVIERSGNRALVVSCSHVFDDTDGEGRVRVTIFGDNSAERTVEAVLLGRSDRMDVAIIRVEDIGGVQPIPLAPTDPTSTSIGPVLVAGCDGGGLPSTWNTHLTTINRFYGRPTLGTAEIPVSGRSGGAAVDAHGQLIGVCNAANPLHREGIYAGVSAVHKLIDTVGDWTTSQPLTTPVRVPEPTKSLNSNDLIEPVLEDVVAEPRIARPMTNDAGELEVVCIVRRKGGAKAGARLIYVAEPSRNLYEQILAEAGRNQ